MESVVICAIGAHPDDCEVHMGGSAALWAKAGAEIHFISVTDGQCGHYSLSKESLSERRLEEAQRSASVIGAQYHMLGASDGHLEPTLFFRIKLIRLIRKIKPNVIILNRLQDYHPDHRYTAQLVLDTAFSLVVPLIAEDTPPLKQNPVFLFWFDKFSYPTPFIPDFFVDISNTFDKKLDMLHQHASQFYEWLPWLHKIEHEVPIDECDQRDWLCSFYENCMVYPKLEPHKEKLIEQFGKVQTSRISHVEAFRFCQYGSNLSPSLQAFLSG